MSLLRLLLLVLFLPTPSLWAQSAAAPVAAAPVTLGAAPPVASPELLRLQVDLVLARDEVLRLKTVILNLQIGQLEQERARLTAERLQVEERLRAAFQPPVDHVYDWQRQQFVPRPETPQ